MVEVNIGAAANDGTGDPLRTAFAKVNADITTLKTGLAAIEQVPDAVALTQAVADAQASAISAASDAELVDTALASTSNAIFGVGDSGAGLTYDVMIADRAIVSEGTALPFPQIQVEIEPGTVVALLKAEAADGISDLADAAAASATAADTSADQAAASAASVASALSTRLEKSLNLSDLASAAAARGNLGLSGVGSSTVAQSADIDAIAAGGMYSFGAAATGNPAPGAAGSVLHVTGDASTAAYQIASIYGSQAVFRRAKSGGVWGAWAELQIKNPTNLQTLGSADNFFAGGIQARNNGAGTAGVAFDGNIRGALVGGMQVQDTGSWGTAVRLLANRTGGADGDRRFTALQINSDGQQFSAHVGSPWVFLPQYACRAYANFNGPNLALRSAGNLTGYRVTNGHYVFNFVVPMPDAGYVVNVTAGGSGTNTSGNALVAWAHNLTTTGFQVSVSDVNILANVDPTWGMISVFR